MLTLGVDHSKMSKSITYTNCSVCPKLVERRLEEKRHFNDNEHDIKLFLFQILNLNPNENITNNWTFSLGFPFCKSCTEKITDLRSMYTDMKVLEQQFESMKKELQMEIIHTFLQRKRGFGLGPYCLNPSYNIQHRCPSKHVQNSILERWNTLPVNIEKSVRKHWNSESLDAETQVEIKLLCPLEDESVSEFACDVEEEMCSPSSPNHENLEPQLLSRTDLLHSPQKNCLQQEIKKNTGSLVAKEKALDIKNKSDGNTEKIKDKQFKVLGFNKTDQGKKSSNEKLKLNTRLRVQKSETSQKRVECPVCHKMFYKGYLHSHLRSHERCGKKRHSCDECSQLFPSKQNLITHKRREHNKGKMISTNKMANREASYKRTYVCFLCLKQCLWVGNYLRHLKRVHYPTNEINQKAAIWYHYCDAKDCKLSFSDQDALNQHLLGFKHVDNKDESVTTKCVDCNRLFATPENCESHKTCHSDQFIYGCEYCHLVFNSMESYNAHKPRHEVIFDVSRFTHLCDQCGEGFTSSVKLSIHRNNHNKSKSGAFSLLEDSSKKFKQTRKICEHCGSLVHVKKLKSHMFIHTHPEGFGCSRCDHRAANPEEILRHTFRQHGPTFSDADRKAIQQKFSLGSQYCHYCQSKCFGRAEMRKHLLDVHPKEHTGKVWCIACFTMFEDEEEMNIHFLERHSNLICTECGQKISSQYALRNHKFRHTDLRPYQCTYCPHRFNNWTTLNYHTHVKHTFHRTFLCRLCPEHPGFYEKRTMVRHTEKSHPGVTVEEILKIDRCSV